MENSTDRVLYMPPKRLGTTQSSSFRNFTHGFFSPEQKRYYASDRFIKDVQKDVYTYGLSDPRVQTRLSYWTYGWVRNFRRRNLDGIPDEIINVRNVTTVGNKTVVSYNLEQTYQGRMLNGVSQQEIFTFLDVSCFNSPCI
jgi:hypothetical protein